MPKKDTIACSNSSPLSKDGDKSTTKSRISKVRSRHGMTIRSNIGWDGQQAALPGSDVGSSISGRSHPRSLRLGHVHWWTDPVVTTIGVGLIIITKLSRGILEGGRQLLVVPL